MTRMTAYPICTECGNPVAPGFGEQHPSGEFIHYACMDLARSTAPGEDVDDAVIEAVVTKAKEVRSLLRSAETQIQTGMIHIGKLFERQTELQDRLTSLEGWLAAHSVNLKEIIKP